jgi:hypothetical protein
VESLNLREKIKHPTIATPNFFWKLKLCKQNEVVPSETGRAKVSLHIKSFS